MENLVIPLASITEDGFNFDVTVPGARLQPDGVKEDFVIGDVRVSGILTAVESEYLFRGAISGAYTNACDRCLETSQAPYRLDVVWFFEHGAAPDLLEDLDTYEVDETAGDEDRIRTFVGENIDLTVPVWEEVVLTAPSKFLCKPDCKGLCPKCGANLNHGPCGCPATEEANQSGLAALKDMFPNLRPSED